MIAAVKRSRKFYFDKLYIFSKRILYSFADLIVMSFVILKQNYVM